MLFAIFVPLQVVIITRFSVIYEVVITQEYITPHTGSTDVFLASLNMACTGFEVRVSVRIIKIFAAWSFLFTGVGMMVGLIEAQARPYYGDYCLTSIHRPLQWS